MDALISLAILALCSIASQARPYHHRPAGYYAPAPVGHDGRVIDTPEVAQAKAAHLAAYSRAASRPANPHYNPPNQAAYQPQAAYSSPGFFSARVQHGPYGYQGPPAPLAHDGRVIDTPEVAQAKAAHFAAFSQAASRSYDGPPSSYNGDSSSNDDYSDYGVGASYSNNSDDDGSGSEEGNYDGQQQYQGPPAPLAQDGRVIDTPEVAQAKAAHLAALQRAQQNAPQPVHNGYYGDY